MTVDDELFDRAIRAYTEVLALGEPMRLRLWDSRGLTMTQLRLMFTLLQEDGISMSAVAERMDLSPSAMTGIIDRLSRMKLIRRRPDREDRRVARICLTEEGRALSAEIDATGRALVTTVVQELGRGKVETFIEALNEFLKAAKAVGDVEISPQSQENQGGVR